MFVVDGSVFLTSSSRGLPHRPLAMSATTSMVDSPSNPRNSSVIATVTRCFFAEEGEAGADMMCVCVCDASGCE